jgi:hypothetical protein
LSARRGADASEKDASSGQKAWLYSLIALGFADTCHSGSHRSTAA